MIIYLTLILTFVKNILPLIIYRRIGFRLGNQFAATILGFSICYIPFVRSFSRYLSIYSLGSDKSFVSFYFYNSFAFDLIYIVTFGLFFGLLIRFKFLYWFTPFLYISSLRVAFCKLIKTLTNNVPLHRFYLLASVSSLGLLLSLSSAHSLWITNPRLAYIEGRRGVGIIYVLFVFFINMSSYYLARSHFSKYRSQYLVLLAPRYALSLFSTLILSFLTGTKSVPLSVILTQVILYIAYSRITLKSLVSGILHRFRVHVLIIISFIIAFLSFTYILYSLSGTTLTNYLTESSFLYEQIQFVRNSPTDADNNLNILNLILLVNIPSSLQRIFNLPPNPLLQYTATILNVDPETMVNFPAIDPAMFSKYALGPFFFLAPIISAFISSLPFASLYHICSITHSKYKSIDHDFLMCSFALSFFPLIHPLLALNLFSLFALI